MLTISVQDEVTEMVHDLHLVLGESHMNPKLGATMVKLFQNHFSQQPENAKHWPTQHYWGDAAKSTSYELLPDGFVLRVAQPGVNMHVTGLPSVIRPVNAKNLAIPATEAAYGRRPGEFTNLRVAFRRVGGTIEAYALVEKSEPGHRGNKAPHPQYTKGIHGKVNPIKIKSAVNVAGGGKKYVTRPSMAHTGMPIFWLKKEVRPHQRPHTVPTEDQMRDALLVTAESELNQLAHKHNP